MYRCAMNTKRQLSAFVNGRKSNQDEAVTMVDRRLNTASRRNSGLFIYYLLKYRFRTDMRTNHQIYSIGSRGVGLSSSCVAVAATVAILLVVCGIGNDDDRQSATDHATNTNCDKQTTIQTTINTTIYTSLCVCVHG